MNKLLIKLGWKKPNNTWRLSEIALDLTVLAALTIVPYIYWG